jgi:Tol biopolymer transport system component
MRCARQLFNLFLLLLISCSSALAADGFSLEQVLNSPFPTELTGSSRGDVIAWVFNDEGKRNIWIARAPSFRPTQMTRFDSDDGQEITELVFSPDSNWLAFVRGGPSSANEEAPNPAGLASGTQQQIWLANLRNGRSEAIAAGSDHFFSPKGDRLFYIAEGSSGRLFSVGVGPRTIRSEALLQKTLNFRGGFAFPEWSADGSRLVFVTLRGDHNFISLYDEMRGRVRYLDPSSDRDVEPVWSPNGKQIAFIRLLNVVDTFGPDKERLQPWSIRIVDVDTGKAKEVWRSGEKETDSYSMPGKLAWLSADKLVFGSEADGWAHLYSVATVGGTATQLTRGKFEVSQCVLSPDRSFAVLATNEKDIDRSHLWRLDIATGTLRQLTTGQSIEYFPIVIDNGKQIAFLRSTGIEPLLPFVIAADGSAMRPLAKVDPGFPPRIWLSLNKWLSKRLTVLMCTASCSNRKVLQVGNPPLFICTADLNDRCFLVGTGITTITTPTG